jgi:hypothetical protein
MITKVKGILAPSMICAKPAGDLIGALAYLNSQTTPEGAKRFGAAEKSEHAGDSAILEGLIF